MYILEWHGRSAKVNKKNLYMSLNFVLCLLVRSTSVGNSAQLVLHVKFGHFQLP